MKRYTDPKISPANLDISQQWYVHFRFKDNTGQWRQYRFKKGINTYKGKRERLIEANALRQALREELQRGWNPEGVETSTPRYIGDMVQSVLDTKAHTLRPKSRQAYKYIAKLFTEWLTDQNLFYSDPNHLKPETIMPYLDHLLRFKGYSNRTYNDHIIVLSTLFNFMVERDWIAKNPFKKVKRAKASVGRNHAFSPEERKKLTKVLYSRNENLYRFTQFIYYCFIRRTELCTVRVENIDLKNHTITIPGDGAKNLTQESVVIPVGLEPIIEAMELHRLPPKWYVFGRGLKPSAVKVGNPNHISTQHNTICKELGLPEGKGLYSWKHTGVCDAYYATGKDIHSVMRQLRHRDLSTTMIYLKSLGLVQNDVFRQAMK